MKKYVKYLLFVIAVFGINVLTADAKQMPSKDIEPNSYLIGTHVFTSDTELTMKKIMLASKTISGNTEDDMIIYYKDPWGEWSDAVTGKVLSLPEKVEVEFVDLEPQSVCPVLQTPILEKVNYEEIHEDDISIMVSLDFDNFDDSDVVGMELYSSKSVDGTFTKVGEYENDGDPYDYGLAVNTAFVVNKANFGKYYKVRTYSIADNQKIYSEFSNIVEIMGLLGDVNNDETINLQDPMLVNQYLDGIETLTNEQKIAADVNLDEEIDDVDVMILSKYYTDPDGYDITLPYDSGEKYTIEYNLNGGKTEGRNIETYAEISLPYTLKNPEKEGYIFIGWTGSNGDTPQTEVTIEEKTTGNLEYTANWVLLGDVNNDSNINTEDTTLLLRYLAGLDIPSTVNVLYGDVNEDGEIDDVDVMIIRKYRIDSIEKLPYDSGEKYKITYNLNGGTTEDRNIATYAEVSLPYTLKNPEKEGYIFIGWTGSNGETPQKEVTIEEGTTGNLEYTANWVLLGDVNNDELVDIGDVTVLTRYVTGLSELDENQKLVADVNLDKEIDDVDVAILQKSLANEDVTLPYDSGEKYTINYNLDGGIIEEDYNITKYAAISLPYTLKNPEKEGYIFIGWTGSNEETPQKEVTIEEGTTGNLEYTANWAMYGDVNNDKQVDIGDVTVLTRYVTGLSELDENQKLVADVNLDKEIDDVDVAILQKSLANEEVTLPYDSGEKYTIEYNLNGGIIEEDYNITKYAAISLPYTLKNPEKEGYTFLGWTGSNGDTPQTKVTIEKTTTGNLEYTANWEKEN